MIPSRFSKVYVRPLGLVNPGLMRRLCMHMRDALGIEVVLLKKIVLALPAGSGRDPLCSTEIIAMLEGRMRHKDGLVMGVIDRDIRNPIFTFVFGEAAPDAGVAVISLKRLREEFYGRERDAEAMESRLIKVAVHEVGHLMGLKHCPNSNCVMSRACTVEELDFKDTFLCKHCREALHTRNLESGMKLATA